MQLEQTHNRQFGQVVKRYLAFQREHNELQESKSTWLREPQQSKFKTLISLYMKDFWNLLNSKVWADSDRVPMICVTRQNLANLCGCKKKAVYNHLARLSAIGLITIEEVSHGKVNGYNISINLYFMLGIEEFKPKIKKFQAKEVEKIVRTPSPLVPTLPHLINQKEILNNTYKGIDVDMCHEINPERHQEINQGKAETANPTLNNHEKNQEITLGGGEIFSFKTDAELTNENINRWAEKVLKSGQGEQEETRPSSSDQNWERFKTGKFLTNSMKAIKKPDEIITEQDKQRHVNNFWNLQMEISYPGRNFKNIELEIKKIIRQEVFDEFRESQNPIFWQLESLKLQAWAEKKANFDHKNGREAYFPTKYFLKSYGNSAKQGFLVIREWDKKHQKSLKEIEFDKVLDKAKLSMSMYSSTRIAPRGQQNKIFNIQQLAQYWYRKVSFQTDSDHLQAFNNFLSLQNLTSNHHANSNNITN